MILSPVKEQLYEAIETMPIVIIIVIIIVIVIVIADVWNSVGQGVDNIYLSDDVNSNETVVPTAVLSIPIYYSEQKPHLLVSVNQRWQLHVTRLSIKHIVYYSGTRSRTGRINVITPLTTVLHT